MQIVLNDTIINNSLTYHLVSFLTNTNLTDSIIDDYYAKNDQFGHWYGYSSDNFELYISYPAKINDLINPKSGTIKLISKNDKVTTQAGTFICHHFQCKTNDPNTGKTINQGDVYYSVGVGLIKEVIFGTRLAYYQGGAILVKSDISTELTEYSVK